MNGWYFIIVLTILLLVLGCREVRECDTLRIDAEQDEPNTKPSEASPPFNKTNDSQCAWCDYPKKPENVIALLTLIAVGCYTFLTRYEVQSANKQVLIMQDQEDRQLRGYAYAVINSATYSNPSGDVNVGIDILGQTPIYHVHTMADSEFYCPGDQFNVPATNRWQNNTITDAMFPGENNESDDVKFTLRAYEAPKLGVKGCQEVIFGQILYLDAFAHPHFTTFCYLYNPASTDGKFTRLCLNMNGSDGDDADYQDIIQNPAQPNPWLN